MKKSLFIVFILFVAGCSHEAKQTVKLNENGEIAKHHLEDMGYEVVSYEGENTKVFTGAEFSNDKDIWGVQYTEPDDYMNKEVQVEHFFIKNHPLDQEFDMGKTNAYVMIQKKKVIGGWSYPHSKQNDLMGGSYSLDGKTNEEVRSDWQVWSQEWDRKYQK